MFPECSLKIALSACYMSAQKATSSQWGSNMASHGITLKTVRALALNSVVWDGTIPGFGCRRQKSDARVYFLTYRFEGRLRWLTIGRHGAPWTPELARAEALRFLGSITGAYTNGVKSDPALVKEAARTAPTVAKLCNLYIDAIESGRLLTKRGTSKTAATLSSDKARIGRHIKPLLGDRLVAAVTREDIEAFQHKVTNGETSNRKDAGRGAATRTLGLLGAIFTYAVEQRMRPDNPVRGVRRAQDGKRARRLSADEYAALGQALRDAEMNGIHPAATAVVRFLCLTGWRKGEAEGLVWTQVDLPRRTAILTETKSGRSIRPIGQDACAVLGQQGTPNGGLVFKGPRGDAVLDLHDGSWAKLIALAKLPSDVTPHVLRHSFTSEANDLGLTDATIAMLVGHQKRSMTGRYTHGADTVLLDAADKVSGRIAALMGN
jgi:integrase